MRNLFFSTPGKIESGESGNIPLSGCHALAEKQWIIEFLN